MNLSLPLFFLLCIACGSAWAQFPYTGGLVSQRFDALPRSETFDYSDFGIAKGPAALSTAPLSVSGAVGWSLYARSGTQLLFNVGQGSVGTASLYSFGHHAAEDRALGSLAGSNHAANLGWRVQNLTGETLSSFTLSFYAEQWRNGGTASLVGLVGEYRLTPSGDIDSGTYISLPNLDAPAVSAVSGSSFAMNGNSANNRTERSVTVMGINWQPNQLLIIRWRDLDESGADNATALDDVLFYAPRMANTAPTVAEVQPSPGASHVPTQAPIRVIFDQPVSVNGTWYEITGSLSGPLSATVSQAGPLRFTLSPTAPWPSGETITVRVIASQVTNAAAQGMPADHIWTFQTLPSTSSTIPISRVQSTDGYSPLTGSVVKVEGMVTASFQGASPALGGFFLQEESSDEDGDSETSEGLWIADLGSPSSIPVSPGDRVQVTGTVSESGNLTQLVSPSAISITGQASVPLSAPLSLPSASSISLERLENMSAHISQTLTVTNNSGSTGTTDSFARFGELLLASAGPLTTPTEWIDPNDSPASGTTTTGKSQAAIIHQQERADTLRTLVLDDASSAQYPDPTPYLNAAGTRRCGDTVSGLTGIFTYANGAYRIQPTQSVIFSDSNPRPITAPGGSGRLKIASMNVLNYFITFGGPNDRGASSEAEFQRQKAKVLSALIGLDADVLCLMEIQNSSAAVADLLTGLNALISTPYTLLPDPTGGYPEAGTAGDYIRCVILYRGTKVTPHSTCEMDTDAVWNSPDPLRFPLAQNFEELSTGERFMVCVNHWKSKSSSGATGLNTDQNDGQAAFNLLRKQQAARLHTWLQTVATAQGETDLLIVGDLNSYGEEDPLDTLRGLGWSDQGQRFHGTAGYSYRIGGKRGRLDHAFATSTMENQISSFNHWHINADEPAFYDYNLENKTTPHANNNAGTPFRSSDHDPLLIGISLSAQPTSYSQWVASRIWQPQAETQAGADPDHDGKANLIEFALNTPPEQASLPQLPIAEWSSGVLHLDYRSRVAMVGVTVQAEWSLDLLQWHPMNTVTTESQIDLRTELKRASHSFSAPLPTRVFTRLQVTTTP